MNNNLRIIIFCCVLLAGGCRTDLSTVRQNCTVVNKTPDIRPDYAGITIPPNIAPMNFSLTDSCAACLAEITSVNGPAVTVQGRKGDFIINEASWRRLVSENAGNRLWITVYAKNDKGEWRRYKTIENTIAKESIDRYCTYRLLNFQYSYWRDLRMCQRDLSSFKENVLVNTNNYTRNYMENNAFKCVNCHTPMNNNPDRFILQLRSASGGAETLIADGDSIITLSSRLGHASWHPHGKYIAFSVYKVQQYFHAVGRQFIDVYDKNSCIVIYDVARRKIVPVPQLSQQGTLGTWPAWSPDGSYLYFCSSPAPQGDTGKESPDSFNKTKYSLLRIAYDSNFDKWGDIDTVLSAAQSGLSIALPRISPDNKFCIFCMQDYGPYPYTKAGSDLYIMDIGTKQYRKLDINSEYNESWHSWSANGRWILFASRRGGGIFTRLYISYIDTVGNAAKAFVMPQRDPEFYELFTKCYNVQELASGTVRFSERQLFKAIQSRRTISVPLPAGTVPTSADTSANSWKYGSSLE